MERASMFPELSAPSTSKTSGILSTIPTSCLFLEDFAASPGFKVLLVSCDGCNTNLAALRMRTSELQSMPMLLVIPVICTAHAVNNSIKWGLGVALCQHQIQHLTLVTKVEYKTH